MLKPHRAICAAVASQHLCKSSLFTLVMARPLGSSHPLMVTDVLVRRMSSKRRSHSPSSSRGKRKAPQSAGLVGSGKSVKDPSPLPPTLQAREEEEEEAEDIYSFDLHLKPKLSQAFEERLDNLEILSLDTVESIISLFHERGRTMSSVNVATLLYRVGKLQQENPSRRAALAGDKDYIRDMRAIYDHVQLMIPLMDSRPLANVVWGAANSGVSGASLLDVAAKRICEISASTYNPHAISCILSGYMKAGGVNSAVYTKMEEAVVRTDKTLFDSQAISIVLNAYSKAGYVNSPVFNVMNTRISVCNNINFSGQEIATILGAFSRSGYHAVETFEVLSDRLALTDMSNYAPQAISNILHAYTKARLFTSPIFETVEKQLLEREGGMHNFNGQAVAVTLNCYSKAGLYNSSVYNLAEELVVEKGVEGVGFEPQGLAMLTNAFAVAGRRSSPVFKVVEDYITPQIIRESFAAKSVASVLYAYSKVSRDSSPLFDTINNALGAMPLETFTPHDISTILTAYSNCRKFDSSVFFLLDQHICSMDLTKFKVQDFLQILNAYSNASRHYKASVFDVFDNHLNGDNPVNSEIPKLGGSNGKSWFSSSVKMPHKGSKSQVVRAVNGSK
jgi:hypothetical protein